MSTRSISRTRPCWGLRTNHTGARVYIALLEWGILMAAIKVGLAIRSDSTVVLALLEKAASSSTALNLLAAGKWRCAWKSCRLARSSCYTCRAKSMFFADWLSESRGAMPSQLQGVKIGKAQKLNRSQFSLCVACSHDASGGSIMGSPEGVKA